MAKPTVPLPILSEEKIKLFWSRVKIGTADECWPWIAGRTTTKKGQTYGVFSTDTYRSIAAHRVAYFLTTGDNPVGFLVRHLVCDNPPCCNPAHLAKGTYADNNGDAKRKGRTALGNKNGARLYPEKLHYGDDHWTRKQPEKLARGSKNGASTHPEKIRRGSAHGYARLTEAKVLEIREAYANGQRICDLAKVYGVAEGTIDFVVLRKTWKHV